jgi:glycosyltransferase involved in cell wall biosynthesis
MRILHVTDNYLPARGGLERTVSTIAQGQAAAGHEVAVATLSRVDAPASEVLGGVEVHRLDGWIRHLRRFAADPGHQYHPTFADPRLVAALQKLVDRFAPDVVHAHGWMLYSIARVRRAPGTALVVGLHDFSLICANKALLRAGAVCEGPELFRCLRCSVATYGAAKGAPLALGLAGQRGVHERVDLFVANSSYVADVSASGSGIPRERIVVVPVPLPHDVAAAAASDVPRPSFLPDGDFVLFVGALGRHKGLDVLLEAHARLDPPVPLVILGIPRRDSPSCDRPGVLVRRDVPHEQVMACWRAAAVGAAPSVCAEAFGLVALEGMAAGTPMVVSAVGGLQEVVEPGVSGLVVPPGDPAALATALRRLLDDPELRASMGTAGIRRARNYGLSAMLPELQQCYAEARRRAGAGSVRPSGPRSGPATPPDVSGSEGFRA